MTDHRTDPSLQDLDRGLLISAGVMLGLASLSGLAGFAVLAAAVITAARRWYRRADLTPQDLANLKWQQAKAAMGAGAGAWRDTERSTHSPRRVRGTMA